MSWPAIIGIAGAALAAVAGGVMYLTRMPGPVHNGALPPLTPQEQESSGVLRRHVQTLAGEIGGRSLHRPGSLEETASYIEHQLRSYGYAPVRHTFGAHGREFHNVEARGASGRVVIGAHYDTAGGLPGANDNGSGVAATLELARSVASQPAAAQLRFVFFVNEEPPYFQTEAMGSYAYARRCRAEGDAIDAMVSLETIGYYSDEPGSQSYPIGFHPGYPDRGNFLGFVSDPKSAPLLRRFVKAFRSATPLPAEGSAAPASIPGVGWSDHWSFWQFGYRALMVTDTAPYRYPYYHTAEDTPEKLDYDRLARALTGLRAAILALADYSQ
jgi:hypothetical protein